MNIINIAIHPKSKEHFDKFKKALELIDLKFELKETIDDQTYSEDFINEIEEAKQDFQKENFISLKDKKQIHDFFESL